jgi:hypothetical protein
MPASNRTAPPHALNLPTGPLAGVKVSEQSWGIIYQGDKEALLAAGVLREEWMPRVPPGKKKTVGRTMLPDGREVHVSYIHRARKAGRELPLDVRHSFTDEETAQRQPRFDAARMAERAHAEAEREIAKWPASKEVFAGWLERNGCWFLQTIYDFAKDGLGGYRVTPASMLEITDAHLALVQAMRDAEIAYYPAERAKAEALLRSKAASHDPAFGAFLDRVMTAPDDGGATA